MNETEITKKVQAMEIAPKEETKRTIGCFLACVREALKEGEAVKIKDLGTFTVAETKPRRGRNPKTGEPIEIPAKKALKFRPSPNFTKNILNGGKEA